MSAVEILVVVLIVVLLVVGPFLFHRRFREGPFKVRSLIPYMLGALAALVAIALGAMPPAD